MIKLLRYLFVVHYDYRDSVQAMRARVLLPLSSVMAALAVILVLFILVAEMLDLPLRSNTMSQGTIIALLLLLWMGAALWLIQRGHIRLATGLIGLFLGSTAVFSLLADGIRIGPVLMLPVLLAYMGLAYGARGIVVSALFAWILLPLTASLQADGTLAVAAQPRRDLMREALVGAGLITLAAILMGVFAWNLQRALFQLARTAARTRAVAEVGQSLSRILNIDELITHAVEMIRDRFALYHVQIFLLDEARAYANLAASTGAAGHALLAQGYRVAVGSRTVVGDVIASGEMRYVDNLASTAYRRPEPLLDTQTELALPLKIGEDLIGVLDIQSLRPKAFEPEDIETMYVLATQVGQAIQNARLFETQQRGLLQNRRLFLESETNLREIQRLNRQLTGQSWHEYIEQHGGDQVGVQVKGQEIHTGPVEWTPAMQQAVSRQHLIAEDKEGEQILAVPIIIRGQPIGAIEVRHSGGPSQPDIQHVLQAVAERMAFSLEDARLFEQAQMAAEREQQINLISTRLQGLTTVEDVLTTALSTLGEALDAHQGTIRLVALDSLPAAGEEMPPPAGNGHRPASKVDTQDIGL